MSGTIPKTSLTWSSIDRCCAVTVTRVANSSLAVSTWISGATFTASGRVPYATMTVRRGRLPFARCRGGPSAVFRVPLTASGPVIPPPW